MQGNALAWLNVADQEFVDVICFYLQRAQVRHQHDAGAGDQRVAGVREQAGDGAREGRRQHLDLGRPADSGQLSAGLNAVADRHAQPEQNAARKRTDACLTDRRNHAMSDQAATARSHLCGRVSRRRGARSLPSDDGRHDDQPQQHDGPAHHMPWAAKTRAQAARSRPGTIAGHIRGRGLSWDHHLHPRSLPSLISIRRWATSATSGS